MTDGGISTVGVVTRDRPEPLQRSLESYSRNVRDAGHRPNLVVCDDSTGKSSDANAGIAAEIGRKFGLRVSYLGWREKVQLANVLAGLVEVPARIVRGTILDTLHTGYSRGANTNALILETCGEAFMCFDDDSVCRVARRSQDGGLYFTSRPVQFACYSDEKSLLADVSEAPCDLVSSTVAGSVEPWVRHRAPLVAVTQTRDMSG